MKRRINLFRLILLMLKARQGAIILSVILIGCSAAATAQQDVTYSVYSNQSVITAPRSITFLPGFFVPAGSTFHAYITGPTVSPAPSASMNYIMSAKVKAGGIATESTLTSVLGDKTQVQVSIQYFDGLGRPLQTVQQQGSPLGNDIVIPMIYDSLGRQTKQYLPYVPGSTADGSYRTAAIADQQSFYNSPPAGVVAIPGSSGQLSYQETKYEASPLNRVEQTGFPGGDWKIGSGHTQRRGYGINGANEVVRWMMTSTGASGGTYYPKASLYTDTLTDEDGYKTIIYTDFDQKVLLRKVQAASGYLATYYVYDELNNLRYVLPPGFSSGSFTESDMAFDQFVYAYHYNGRRQVQERKIPGKGWEYFIYNKLDHLVMSQDAAQRSTSPQSWTIFKYDELGRLVLTGVYSHAGSSAGASYLSVQQSAVDAGSAYWESSTGSGTGYTANTYPASWDRTLSVNYFDTYSIPGKSSTYDPTQSVTVRTQGLPTGSKVNILGTSTLLLSINYYDERGRLREGIGDNHLSGLERVVNSWDFSDELTASTRSHWTPIANVTIANRYIYDHLGRKTKTYERIGTDAEVLLSELAYNELGQLYSKSLHNGTLTETMEYNSRGWLVGQSSPLFAFQLKYADGTYPRYNGNISNQLWGTPGSLSNHFTYSYDPLNRLNSGDTGTGVYEKDISYDVMGNITSLNRNGTGTQSYSYSGNRLSGISGGISRSYSYDANGNMTGDGINTFTYNLLNLPATVSGGASVSYTYDALGRKLTAVNGGVTTDYLNGIQYTGGAIDFIQTEEGLARRNGSGYLYEYSIRDHLGNNRLSFDIYGGAAREIQHDSYYPFGKTYNSYTLGTRNNYLYNSKELQGGLNQYDYGARFYDPESARWTTIDPLAENGRRFSPYCYAVNNPMRYTDPDGMWITDEYGNQFTTDFGDISDILNTVVNPILQSQQQQLQDPERTYVMNAGVGDVDMGDGQDGDGNDGPGDPKKKKANQGGDCCKTGPNTNSDGSQYIDYARLISGGISAGNVLLNKSALSSLPKWFVGNYGRAIVTPGAKDFTSVLSIQFRRIGWQYGGRIVGTAANAVYIGTTVYENVSYEKDIIQGKQNFDQVQSHYDNVTVNPMFWLYKRIEPWLINLGK